MTGTSLTHPRLTQGWKKGIEDVVSTIAAAIGPARVGWQHNTYAPGRYPLERSVFVSRPEEIRVAFEPLAWGSPEERRIRARALHGAEWVPESRESWAFGVYRGLRRRSLGRLSWLSYVECPGCPAIRQGLVPLFDRVGAGPRRRYFELPRVEGVHNLGERVGEMRGARAARDFVQRWRGVGRSQGWLSNSVVVSGLDEPDIKVEMRTRGQLAEEEILSLALRGSRRSSQKSFLEGLGALELELNILSFRIGREGVMDAGVYGSPRLEQW